MSQEPTQDPEDDEEREPTRDWTQCDACGKPILSVYVGGLCDRCAYKADGLF